MNWKKLLLTGTALALLFATQASVHGFGRGGRMGGGGGGGMRGGGGGFGGGGGGGFGGGGARPSGGFSGGGARPNIGSSPSFNRPSTPIRNNSSPLGGGGGLRDNAAGAGLNNRPTTLPGNLNNRPNLDNRPALSNRPGLDNRPGLENRPGLSNLPGTGSQLPGLRPGAGERPTTLPGLPGLGGATGDRLANRPNAGNLENRVQNRPQTLEDRRSDLSNRLQTGREDWQNHRGDMQGNRQDWRDANREDWQNYAHDYHGGWYHGCWEPGHAWDYMWDNYPVYSAFGVTRWGLNRIAYGFGYWGYTNPYYVASPSVSYNYSSPIVVYSDSGSGGSADPSAATATGDPAQAAPPAPNEQGMTAFDASRSLFSQGKYEEALQQLQTTLQSMPQDPVVHEYHGLLLFALKRYPEAAGAVYAVLSAGPGWDWTTLSSMYPQIHVYTDQLRALESFTKSNPSSGNAAFLLGYHYMVMGHTDAAAKSFSAALKLNPDDKLLKQLVELTSPPSPAASQTPPVPPAAGISDSPAVTAEQLTGTWTATSKDSGFELEITAEGKFVWTYTQGGSSQAVRGVYAIDQATLAMQPDSGGTMVADIKFTAPTAFTFTMVGADAGDDGLKFAKKP